ncbi:MAG: beta-lactamase family protein, partial [Acidobacteria bacterium]|nr:beta-lactamase family protein [Acidobacteriota bacterium]
MKRPAVLFCLICLLLTMPIAAQQPGEISYRDTPEMPEGIKGERIQSLIAAVNSNNPETVRRFVESAFTERFQQIAPIEEHVEILLGIYQETGGIAFHGIRSYVPERNDGTVVILKDNIFDSWRAFLIGFDEGEDSLIAGLRFADARSPSDVKVEALNEQEVIEKIRSIVEGLVERNVFSGTVLVAKGSDVLYSAAAGGASKRFHVANNIDTKFNLGSMNKMFTSVAVMQLVEQGKINLNDPLSMYLDETWLPKDVTEKITIHHLLTHTSGLGSYF